MAYPPEVLGSYAFLADGERGALIGPRGDIAWMCAPGWDSDAVFTSLIGGKSFYAVTPTERFTWGGYYEAASLIWRSRWVTTAGVIECREALAFPGDSDRAVILRQVRSPEAAQQVDIRLAPTAGFDRDPLSDLHHHGRIWTGRLGALFLRWQGPDAVHVASFGSDGHQLYAQANVSPEQTLDLVLEVSFIRSTTMSPTRCGLASHRRGLEAGDPKLTDTLDPKASALAYAVMRGLTSSGGGMVAAATTSLPERAEQGRNYDYRYVWIRDQAYAGQAVAAAGGGELLDSATGSSPPASSTDGPTLAPAYRSDGTAVPDQRRIELAGYPGGFDLVGNHVNRQFQLDAFGEALLLLAAAGVWIASTSTLSRRRRLPPMPSPSGGRTQTPGSGRSMTGPGPTADSSAPPAFASAARVLAPSSGSAGPLVASSRPDRGGDRHHVAESRGILATVARRPGS